MAIIDLQRSVRQVGRVRLGEQVAGHNGKSRPVKLTTFRLTSPQRAPIDRAAGLYGGDVNEFKNERSDDRWQVTTKADSIPVVIPPTHHLDQWMELWAGFGCDRRCDGQRMTVNDGRSTDEACACDPDNRACKITTRLWVILPELEALGVWRVETHGWYAATELAGAADLCAAVTAQGRAIPAKLELEQRTRRTKVDGKPQTFKFSVPVLSVDVSIPQAQAILGNVDRDTGEIGPTARRLAAAPEPRQLEVRTPSAAPQPALPPPPPATIPTPRLAEQYQADQEGPELAEADEVSSLVSDMNSIEDEAVRRSVKGRFVDKFGPPRALAATAWQDAHDWVYTEVVTARFDAEEATPVEIVEQPKLLDAPADRDHTPVDGRGDRKPSQAQKKLALALIGELVSSPRFPEITSSDDYRHERIKALTFGRTESITEITALEIDQLIGDIQALQRGEA